MKRILIPLDTSPYSDTALDVGCVIAKQHDAELTGLVVLDIPGIKKSIGPVPLGGFYYAEKLEKEKEREARKRIQKLIAKFREKCTKEGVKYREAETQGSPSEQIVKESIFFDAIIIGLKTYFHFETSNNPGNSLDEIMDHTITPIYAVPERLNISKTKSEKIKALIPFDGSLPSARALHNFAHLGFFEVMEVTLLNSNPEKDAARYYLDQAEAYLRSHSIENIKKEWTAKKIIDVVDEYLDWANIVVVGAHSKKSLIDFMVGSLTKHLIKEAKKPLLIG